jgi:hypothetical protein
VATLGDGNGGFPEPPVGEPVRVVSCSHQACGSETRVRLPGRLPAGTVRRVVCGGCGQAYECGQVEDVEAVAPPVAPPAAPAPPAAEPPRGQGRAWRLVSIPIAAAAVVGALLVIRGLEDDEGTDQSGATSPAAPEAAAPVAPEANQAPAGDARVVREPTFTLALPPGWARTDPPPGATFAARSQDGAGEAALWVRREPDLAFGAFEARSLKQLRQLAGSAEVVKRVTGPSPEETIVRLRSGKRPAGTGPVYEVTLRAFGPYRYYLSTTLGAGASREASEGVALIHSSFLPARE